MATHEYQLALCGRNLANARNVVAEHMEAARLTALAAIADGLTEAEIARALGIDRMTVRKWQGKR